MNHFLAKIQVADRRFRTLGFLQQSAGPGSAPLLALGIAVGFALTFAAKELIFGRVYSVRARSRSAHTARFGTRRDEIACGAGSGSACGLNRT